MVAFGSIIPLEQGGRRVFGMSWMPVSGVCIGSRVERAVRDASRTHFHVGTGISWNLETPGVSRKKQREYCVYHFEIVRLHTRCNPQLVLDLDMYRGHMLSIGF